MKNFEYSISVKSLIVDPLNGLNNLKIYYENNLAECNSELEYIARHREITCYFFDLREIKNFDLVQKYIDIEVSRQVRFKRLIEILKENHNKIKPILKYGRFNSTKNGINYLFYYTYEKRYIIEYHGICYEFNITESKNDISSGFSYVLRVMENGLDLKVVDLYPETDTNSKYLGKGISIGIILHSKELFNKRIISSSNKKLQTDYDEFNSEEAIDKVWKRLEDRELVGYNEKEGYYFTK